uniref:Uncharacterized protein n=1 Tax=Molossus molossus TaxID=27622 RepID=A0A7J8E3A6_MOLMO|nr:hypothetical protein HJG59_009004 [Molossus molossus]
MHREGRPAETREEGPAPPPPASPADSVFSRSCPRAPSHPLPGPAESPLVLWGLRHLLRRPALRTVFSLGPARVPRPTPFLVLPSPLLSCGACATSSTGQPCGQCFLSVLPTCPIPPPSWSAPTHSTSPLPSDLRVPLH